MMTDEAQSTPARYRESQPTAPPVVAWCMMDPQGRLIVHLHSSERIAWASVADPGADRRQMRQAGWRAVRIKIEVVA